MQKFISALIFLALLFPVAAHAAKAHPARKAPVKTEKKETAPAGSSADNPVLIKAFGDWKAYYFTDQGAKVCFMSSPPEKQEGKFKKRGDVLFFITHWAADKTKNVISVSAGYAYKDESTATVTVDDHDFTLATVGETAWARDSGTDTAIAEAIRKGSSLSVTGTSKHGTKTKDTYSLKGSSAAYEAITKTCGF